MNTEIKRSRLDLVRIVRVSLLPFLLYATYTLAAPIPPGAPTDGKNHGTQKKPIILKEDANTEGSPVRTLSFQLMKGMVNVPEAGGGTSDTIDFMPNADNKNRTDFAITSDKGGDDNGADNLETEGPFSIMNPNDKTVFWYEIYSPAAAGGKGLAVDEHGNGVGTIGAGTLGPDIGPGGLSSVLTYQLPFSGTPGDVLISDQGILQDLIRFNGDGTLLFYSGFTDDGIDSLADVGLPSVFYTNTATLFESGPEGNNGAFYTPTAGQPGFDPGISYQFVSDGSLVPEPSSIVLTLLGLIVLCPAGLLLHKKRSMRDESL